MNAEAYKAAVLKAVTDDDMEFIELVAKILEMADTAKAILRYKGYGQTGLDLLETCKLVNPLYVATSEVLTHGELMEVVL